MIQWSFPLLLAAGVLLSGCSLMPTPLQRGATSTPEEFQTNATPGSIWKSSDGGKHFEPKVKVDEKRRITSAEVLSLSFLPKRPEAPVPDESPGIYAGTIDNGIFRTVSSGEEWEPIDFPPKKVYSFTADRRDPDRMYATGSVGNRGKLYRSKDAGKTWEDIYTEPGTGTTLVSLAEHPIDTSVIFAGTSAGTVVKSTDWGDTWKNVGGTIDGPVVDILFDAKNRFVTYALIHSSKMYYSPDGGITWIDWEKVKQEEREKRQKKAAEDKSGRTSKKLQAELTQEDKRKAPSGMVSLTADPTLSGTLYAGTAQGLYRSLDYGKFWDEINVIESAKKFPIRALAVNPRDSNEVVFAAGHVVYKSTNKGVTWSVTPVNIDRDISTLVYDPYNPELLYFGLRAFSNR